MSKPADFSFFRIATATPEIRVADPAYNLQQHLDFLRRAEKEQVQLLVFPDLSLTGCTCDDLFRQSELLKRAALAVDALAAEVAQTSVSILLSLPATVGDTLCKLNLWLTPQGLSAAQIARIDPGDRQTRWFGNPANRIAAWRDFPLLDEEAVFHADYATDISFSVVNSLQQLYQSACFHGNTSIIQVVLSSSPELAGRADYVTRTVAAWADLHDSAIIYVSPNRGESTTDFVYSGRSVIYEKKDCLRSGSLFQPQLLVADLDTERLLAERRSRPNPDGKNNLDLWALPLAPLRAERLCREIPRNPFLSFDPAQRDERFESLLQIAAEGLRKRLAHIPGSRPVLGLSGGLDSTIAALIARRSLLSLGQDASQLLCVSMPGFGTTKRTFNNAQALAASLGATYREISITRAVEQHFRDIGHDPEVHDVTYENAQARERTQILMDLANQEGGFVLGTGDLSESALGFTTYNADHISMYNVNTSIPKTLLRQLVQHEATLAEPQLAAVLQSILATPVSPELLPPTNGEISQQTEQIVGPYDLHDFFLYYHLRYQYSPAKIRFLAEQAFADTYESAVIDHWLRLFYKRFFNNQFKRSCSADGPALGSVSLSPRDGLKMPSDAISALWLDALDTPDTPAK